MTIDDLPTSCLLLDLDEMRRNIGHTQRQFTAAGTSVSVA
jgi:D-serine deaminase-like pyridoxal phosphate-dependent protein